MSKELTIIEALQKGVEAHKAGQVQEADQYYTAILKANPKHPDANHNMGVLAVGVGKVEAALPFFKTALEVNPSIAQFWLSYIDALIKLDRVDEAKAVFNQAKEHGINGDGLEQLGQRLNGVQEVPQDEFKSLINLYNGGDLRRTLDTASLLLNKFPNSVDLHNVQGAANAGLGFLDEAIESFNKALLIAPENDDSYNNMGNVLRENGNIEEAIEAFKKAVQLQPKNAAALYNLGNALIEKGNIKEALEAYKKSLSLKPENVGAYNNMGSALLKQGKLKEALGTYEKALKIQPDNADLSYNKAILLYKLQELEKAAELFEKVPSSQSQTFLLRILYEQEKKQKFLNQLDYLIRQKEHNAVLGSYISRAQLRYGIKKENPFCDYPLQFVSKIDLTQKCNFEDIFVKGAIDILSDSFIQNRAQSLLNNAVQTSGNVFDQIGASTNKVQNIIRTEIENYRASFKGSNEGYIKNWPSSYELTGWLVSMKSGGNIEPHIHETGWVSGSIYINVPPDLNDDEGNLVVCLSDEILENGTETNSNSINVSTGTLCLFPASLLHYTIPFNSEEDRIVLAFDLIPK